VFNLKISHLYSPTSPSARTLAAKYSHMQHRKIESDFQLDKLFELDIHDELSEEEADEIYTELIFRVGYMMMMFNSLESLVNLCVDKALDPQERRSEINYLLISEMNYSQKVNFMIRNYGQLIYNDERFIKLKAELEILEKNLKDSGSVRNIYAHTDFSTILKGHFIKVKTKAKRDGVVHDYLRFESTDLDDDLKLVLNTKNLLDEFEEKFWRELFSC
jgi:hypothetical protein